MILDEDNGSLTKISYYGFCRRQKYYTYNKTYIYIYKYIVRKQSVKLVFQVSKNMNKLVFWCFKISLVIETEHILHYTFYCIKLYKLL